MSAAAVLPVVQASHGYRASRDRHTQDDFHPIIGGAAFYRKRTEALLRRYMRASMEMGRTPSLLGAVVFRGRVSSYRLTTFEDCIIFIFDVESCLKRLDLESKELIARIALQEYTYEETAQLTGQSARGVGRKYAMALDCLTNFLIEAEILDVSII